MVVMNTSLDELSSQIRLLFHSMVRLSDLAHAEHKVTAPMRAVLEYLHREGAATVPRIADARGVSRQHIQTIVNDLTEAGLLTQVDNPAHRRSRLVLVSASGSKCIEAMSYTEAKLLAGLETSLSAEGVATTERTLHTLRVGFDQLTADLEVSQ